MTSFPPRNTVAWNEITATSAVSSGVAPRRRVRALLGCFVMLLAIVVIRTAWLQARDGDLYRAEAQRPVIRTVSVPAPRGRVLARDGTVLAVDQSNAALAMHYRYLQISPEPGWLRRSALQQLSPHERKDSERIAAQIERQRRKLDQLHKDLAALCGISDTSWNARRRTIETRVRRIAGHVNRRRSRQAAEASEAPGASRFDDAGTPLWKRVSGVIVDALFTPDPPLSTRPIQVAEELDYHVLLESIPLDVVAHIEGRPDEFPGVRIDAQQRRTYPSGTLAAHVIGYVGVAAREDLERTGESGRPVYDAGDWIGRSGVEEHCEAILRGSRGTETRETDRRGQIRSTREGQPPVPGRDVVLSVDVALQRAAESLLNAAERRRALTEEAIVPPDAGGALLVIDVHHGAVLAAASAPRFDLQVFTDRRGDPIERLLNDPRRPLLDRTAQMALPPGSVFKLLTAVALLESGAVDPNVPVECQGYLHQPNRWRCQMFRHEGIGHGPVSLADALARSCNVYFFRQAERLGPGPLVRWAERFHFGRPTGCDWSRESAGRLPTPQSVRRLAGRPWTAGDTLGLSIGQGELTATPAQICVLTAAIANGGRRVTPHVVEGLALPRRASRSAHDDSDDSDDSDEPYVSPPELIEGLHADALAAVRQGMFRAVDRRGGTAYHVLRLESVAVAAKTGTAETGAARADHAWIAGYVPADRPKFAFVVALAHAGNAAEAAGPVARRLIDAMQRLGYFTPSRVAGGDVTSGR